MPEIRTKLDTPLSLRGRLELIRHARHSPLHAWDAKILSMIVILYMQISVKKSARSQIFESRMAKLTCSLLRTILCDYRTVPWMVEKFPDKRFSRSPALSRV